MTSDWQQAFSAPSAPTFCTAQSTSPAISRKRTRTSSPRALACRMSASQPAFRSQMRVAEDYQKSVPPKGPVFFATCPRGLGEYLAHEIQSKNVSGSVLDVASSGVRFRGTSFETGMRACLWLRTSIRVLHEVAHSDFALRPENRNDHLEGEDIYRFVRHSVDWATILGERSSFSVKVRLSGTENRQSTSRRREESWRSREDRYSRFDSRKPALNETLVQVRAKDAICDAMRDAGFDKPPRPEAHASADLPLFIVVHDCGVTIYRDMAGASLHKRGYRDSVPIHRSSLNECVSAGMSYIAGLKPDGTFENTASTSGQMESAEDLTIIDPMCGSATILIEAALCVKQVAVGLFRKEFAFERWDDFDAQLFASILNEAEHIARDCQHRTVNLIGNDINKGAVSLARQGIRNAGLSDFIRVHNQDIRDFAIPRAPTLVISNPPWGRRLGEEDEAWRDMGDFLRHFCAGSTAVLLSGDNGLTRNLRMRARRKQPVRIGNVDTRVLMYDVLTYEQVKEMTSKRDRSRTGAPVTGCHMADKQDVGEDLGNRSGTIECSPGRVLRTNMCGIAAVVESGKELAWPDWPFFTGSKEAPNVLDRLENANCAKSYSRNLEPLMAVLARRGPDVQKTKTIDLGCGTAITLLGAVLSLRGQDPVAQPACDGENALLFNGEVYDCSFDCGNELQSDDVCDTTFLLRNMETANGNGEKLLELLDSIRGPWSIVYWHQSTRRLYFGRDALGRRSLMMSIGGFGKFAIGSAIPVSHIHGFVEVPPVGLCFLDLNHSGTTFGVIKRQVSRFTSFAALAEDGVEEGTESGVKIVQLEKDPRYVSFLPKRWLRSLQTERLERIPLSTESSAALFLTVFKKSIERRLALTSRVSEENGPRFAVMFSGGIDSLFLALMLDKIMAASHGLDLINVAFGNDGDVSSCPDRINADLAFSELRRLATSGRLIRLIYVDVPPSKADYALREHVRPLIYPCDQLMDDSIGTALWFAGRAGGRCAQSPDGESDSNITETMCSCAKIMFSGLGADELMGGYKGRHRTTFRREGEAGILREMDMDLSRLWYRNLGRDDRVVSDSGRELRHPFLDEDVIDFVTGLPVTEHVCDLLRPDGVGDKHLLRRAAEKLGLSPEATTRSKRAIQFGSRSKHVLERRR